MCETYINLKSIKNQNAMISKFSFPARMLGPVLAAMMLLFPLPSSAQNEQHLFTLGQAVERGIQANPRLAGVRAQIEGAAFGEKSALAAFGPALSANYGMTYDDKPTFGGDRETWTMNLNLSQPLFTGWRLLGTKQRARLLREQAQTLLDARELELIQTIQEQFLRLLKARENVHSVRDSVERLRSHLQRAQAFYEVGLSPKVDVLSAEVELAAAEQDFLVAENSVLTQVARLNTLLNLDLDALVEYVGELTYLPYETELQTCLDRAYTQRPDILLAQKAEKIAAKDSQIIASSFYPQVSADLDYYRRGNDPGVSGDQTRPDPWWTAGMRMNWKVFEWGRTRYDYEQALKNLQRLREETAYLRLEVSFAVKSLHLKLVETSARIAVAGKAREEAREGFRIAQARYQAQVGTHTDVLDAQARLTRNETGLTEALADHQMTLARLFVARGEKNPGLLVP